MGGVDLTGIYRRCSFKEGANNQNRGFYVFSM